jgi:hypothetical protein
VRRGGSEVEGKWEGRRRDRKNFESGRNRTLAGFGRGATKPMQQKNPAALPSTDPGNEFLLSVSGQHTTRGPRTGHQKEAGPHPIFNSFSQLVQLVQVNELNEIGPTFNSSTTTPPRGWGDELEVPVVF